jgi:hypothetical protein
MMIWVDNPINLFARTNGHLLLPTEQEQWSPTLFLETAQPGPLLPAVLETNSQHYRSVWGVAQRPYSYRVDLPEGVGNCFTVCALCLAYYSGNFCGGSL